MLFSAISRLAAVTQLVVASGVFLSFSTASADEYWLRIDRSESSIDIAWPDRAIRYDGFVWLQQDAFRSAAPTAHNVNIQRFENPFEYHIGHHRVDPKTGFPIDSSGWFSANEYPGYDFRMVQFKGPIKQAWLEQLETLGIKPIQYLHPYSYIVWANAQMIDASKAFSVVRWSGGMPPALRAMQLSDQAERDHAHHQALIYRASINQVKEALNKLNVEILSVSQLDTNMALLELNTGSNGLLPIARIPGVLSLQRINQDVTLTSEMTGQSIVGGYNAFNITYPGYPAWLDRVGLDGSGTIVSIVDSGFSLTHQDLVGQYLPCIGTQGSCNQLAFDLIFHGTYTAGIVAGSGATGILHGNPFVHGGQFLSGLGIAPGANLVFQTFYPFLNRVGEPDNGPGGMKPDGMLRIFRDSVDSGAVIANKSWLPTGNPQGYDIPSRQLDMVTRDANPNLPGHQPLLIVQSARNGEGDNDGSIPTPLGCEISTLGGSNEAKNHIVVGVSNLLMTLTEVQRTDIFGISTVSAHGPACDGRITPQIVAPGCDLMLLRSASDISYEQNCGTSLAAPVVTGSAAVFFEYYRSLHGINPSPAMAKAAILGAARNLVGNTDADGGILGHRPDRKQGWGRIDQAAMVDSPFEVTFFDQEFLFTGSGQRWTEALMASDPSAPMRIMLVWTDAPGAGIGGTSMALVNDLDLSAVVNSNRYSGNGIDPLTGMSASGGQSDRINTAEGIFLSPGQHGGTEVEIDILAANIAGDALDPHDQISTPLLRQDFALACYNCRESDMLFKDAFE